MSKLTQLSLTHFRNLSPIHLSLGEGLNLIVGDNAAGKTALIESIWMLSTGRSFRTAKAKQCIQNEQNHLVIYAEVEQNKQTYKIGLQKHPMQTQLKLNQETIHHQSELANKLPVQLLTPESHRLLEEGPKARRQFMDWGCFHQSTEFIQHWKHYRRILKQRNQALKQKLPVAQIQLWDQSLVSSAEAIHQSRQAYVTALMPYLDKFCDALMPELSQLPTLSYRSGWPQHTELVAQLKQSLTKDIQLGHTQYGAHRADIRFKFGQMEAMQILSRGQQKLFVCALLLAQASLYEKETQSPVIMLIDDLPAELDLTHRKTLLTLLNLLNIQHILTSTEASLIPIINPQTAKSWRLKNNDISEIIPKKIK